MGCLVLHREVPAYSYLCVIVPWDTSVTANPLESNISLFYLLHLPSWCIHSYSMQLWHRALAAMLSCAALWAHTTASHVLTLHVRPYCTLLGYMVTWLQFLFWVMSRLVQHKEGKPGVCIAEAGAGACGWGAKPLRSALLLNPGTTQPWPGFGISPGASPATSRHLLVDMCLLPLCHTSTLPAWAGGCSACAVLVHGARSSAPIWGLMMCMWQVVATGWKGHIECFDCSESSEHTLLQFCVFARFH